MKKYLNLFVISTLLLVGVVWALGFFFYDQAPSPTETPKIEPEVTTIIEEVPPNPKKIIGTSVEGRDIVSYTFGNGSTTLLFVGGVHGGYEWNSITLAYEFISALENEEIIIPANLRLVVVPNLNPDGLYLATGLTGEFSSSDILPSDIHETGKGRFNANDVDLNRNFDCKWQKESTWRGKVVSAGKAPFSEPETLALKNLVTNTNPKVAIFWHSQANTVYGSKCREDILPETITLMNLYAKAADYKAVPIFDAYPVSGDAESWLASIGIPAVTVELESRLSSERTRNQAGIMAVLNHYADSI